MIDDNIIALLACPILALIGYLMSDGGRFHNVNNGQRFIIHAVIHEQQKTART